LNLTTSQLQVLEPGEQPCQFGETMDLTTSQKCVGATSVRFTPRWFGDVGSLSTRNLTLHQVSMLRGIR